MMNTFAEFVRRHVLWIWAGALLLLANLVVFLFVSLPKINSEELDRDRLRAALEQQADLRAEADLVISRGGALESRTLELNRFYEQVLEEREAARDGKSKYRRVREEMEDIAARASLNLERVRYVVDEVRGLPLERLSMVFPLRGDYRSLRAFVNGIERSANLLIIEAIELEETGDSGDLSMRMTVSTYFYYPAAELAEESLEESEGATS